MKKILIITIFALLLTGCTKYGKCNVNYTIVYPDTTITYDSTFNYKYTEHNAYKRDPHIPTTNSWRGSNYIEIGDDDLLEQHVQLELIHIKQLKQIKRIIL